MDRQCSSCGGFCKKSGCERENVRPEQEPVAWVSSLDSAQPHCVTDLKYCTVLQHEHGEHLKYIPVYAAPTKKEWVGLTREDWDPSKRAFYFAQGVYWAEAKLREKNG